MSNLINDLKKKANSVQGIAWDNCCRYPDECEQKSLLDSLKKKAECGEKVVFDNCCRYPE